MRDQFTQKERLAKNGINSVKIEILFDILEFGSDQPANFRLTGKLGRTQSDNRCKSCFILKNACKVVMLNTSVVFEPFIKPTSF